MDPKWTSGYVIAASSPHSVSYPSLMAAVLILDKTDLDHLFFEFSNLCTKSVLQPLSYGLSHRFPPPSLHLQRKKKKNPKGKLGWMPLPRTEIISVVATCLLPSMSTERNSRYVPQS